MEIINWVAKRDTFLGWAIIALITQAQKEGRAQPEDFRPSDAMEIEVKIAGIEVPFTALIERLEQDFDRQVRREALAMVTKPCATRPSGGSHGVQNHYQPESCELAYEIMDTIDLFKNATGDLEYEALRGWIPSSEKC